MESFLAEKVKTAPTQPGCYLFMDKQGYVIYVGKAKNLRSRVKSYFTKAAAADERIEYLVPRIADVAYRVADSELDALLLEYRLIKQHKPWFNSQMKADKQRPYLRISSEEPYATLSICVEAADDGAAYYDFFTDEEDVKQTLILLCKVWGLPQCGQRSFAKAQSPCLYHSLGHCMAPCRGTADPAKYAATLDETRRLFSGKPVSRMRELKQDMEHAAEALEFERAATSKALLESLRRVQRKSRSRFHLPSSGATLVFIRPHREKAFSVFYALDGQVLRRTDFPATPGVSDIQAFARSPAASGVALEGSEWLAGCLTAVGAFKQFVVLPNEKSARRIVEKVFRQFAK